MNGWMHTFPGQMDRFQYASVIHISPCNTVGRMDKGTIKFWLFFLLFSCLRVITLKQNNRKALVTYHLDH